MSTPSDADRHTAGWTEAIRTRAKPGRRLRPWLGAFVILTLLPHQLPQRGVIRGVVRDPDGSPLAGARVVARAHIDDVFARPQSSIYTTGDGGYELHPRAGTFELRVDLDGFCGGGRPLVRIAEGAVETVDFALRPSPPEIVDRVQLPLPEDLTRADAVVYMRIARSHAPRLLIPDVSCGNGNVFTEHELEVIAPIKTSSETWPNAERVLFVQPRAGVYVEDRTIVQGPETPYAIGEEYVAFLHWSPDEQRFLSSAAPNAMIPVRDGRIVWQGAVEEGVHDAMPVEAFVELLRELQD